MKRNSRPPCGRCVPRSVSLSGMTGRKNRNRFWSTCSPRSWPASVTWFPLLPDPSELSFPRPDSNPPPALPAMMFPCRSDSGKNRPARNVPAFRTCRHAGRCSTCLRIRLKLRSKTERRSAMPCCPGRKVCPGPNSPFPAVSQTPAAIGSNSGRRRWKNSTRPLLRRCRR